MSDLFNIPENIVPLINQQFPEFMRQDGEGDNFIAFMEAYYEWLGQQYDRNIMKYRDIDTTIDAFISHFKNTYLHNIEFDTATNKKLLVKNSLDLYRSKGSERAIDLLIKLVYGRRASVYYPGDDIFRLSAADYVLPQYIEVTNTPDNIKLVGKQIEGASSGSTAFVEKYFRRKTKTDYIGIVYISNPTGDFVIGEKLIAGDMTTQSRIIGSVTSGIVTTGGSGFAVGDTVVFETDRGKSGKARVSEIGSVSGIVDFTLVNGGFGYSNSAQTIVSEVVLTVDQLATSNTDFPYFTLFNKVTQPIIKLTYENANGTIEIGGNTVLKSNNTTTVGNGLIVRADIDSDDTGIVYVYSTANSELFEDVMIIEGPFDANVTEAVDMTAQATIMGIGNTIQITVAEPNDSLIPAVKVYQFFGNGALQAIGNVQTAYTATTFEVIVEEGILTNGDLILTANSSAPPTANVINVQRKVGVYNSNNTFYANGGITSNAASGVIYSKSTGQNADFMIGDLTNQQTVYLNTDYLNGLTDEDRQYANGDPQPIEAILDVPLDAYAYGFAKNPQGNSGDTIYSCLTFSTFTIGTINSLIGINPGEQYNEDPFVLVLQPEIAGAYQYDYSITYSNADSSFTVGEIVQQTSNTNNTWTVTVADGSDFALGQIVEQSDPAITVGIITGKSGDTLTISDVVGDDFANGNDLYNEDGSSEITNAVHTTNVVTGKGKIVASDGNKLTVSRLLFNGRFDQGKTLVGESSGTTATIDTVVPYTANRQIGFNANVVANTVTSTDTVANIEIIDSGIGYQLNQDVTFYKSDDNQYVGTFRAIHGGVGRSEGYFRSTAGFLSSNKYLYDGDYYQEFSYEVISSIPFARYKQILSKVLHVAGTKLFGSVLIESKIGTSTTIAETIFDQIDV